MYICTMYRYFPFLGHGLSVSWGKNVFLAWIDSDCHEKSLIFVQKKQQKAQKSLSHIGYIRSLIILQKTLFALKNTRFQNDSTAEKKN